MPSRMNPGEVRPASTPGLVPLRTYRVTGRLQQQPQRHWGPQLPDPERQARAPVAGARGRGKIHPDAEVGGQGQEVGRTQKQGEAAR